MSKKKILLAGESWVSTATHIKGFDQFPDRHLPHRRRRIAEGAEGDRFRRDLHAGA